MSGATEPVEPGGPVKPGSQVLPGTPLQRAIDLLEESQELARTGGWEYDVQSGQVSWTAGTYRIYGVGPDFNPSDLSAAMAAYTPASAPIISAAFRRLVETGEPYDLELQLTRGDGLVIWVLTIGRATIKDGKIVRVSGGIMDIDGLKRSQLETARLTAELEERVRERTAKLETINRDLESFTHAISHELKAPLRAIAGFSRMVAEDYAGALDDEGRRMLAVVHDNAVLLDGLLTEILRLARIGTYRLDRARIDMKSMAVAMFHEMASEADIAAVRFEVGDLPDCQGDSTLMRQVWGALLANALKFTAEQATRTITVGAEPGEGGTKYQIKDDGIGFDPAHADRLFLPFERLHPRAAYGGLGTGLAIAKRIVELHGGRIGADGKVGKGAVFWFTMPATTGEGVGGHDDTR